MLWRHTNVINDVTHYENSHVICREISHVIVNNMTMQLITTPRWIMGTSVTCLLIFVKVVCIHQTRTSNHRLQSRCRSKDRLSHDAFWTGIQTLFFTICLLKDRLSHDLFFFAEEYKPFFLLLLYFKPKEAEGGPNRAIYYVIRLIQ